MQNGGGDCSVHTINHTLIPAKNRKSSQQLVDYISRYKGFFEASYRFFRIQYTEHLVAQLLVPLFA